MWSSQCLPGHSHLVLSPCTENPELVCSVQMSLHCPVSQMLLPCVTASQSSWSRGLQQPGLVEVSLPMAKGGTEWALMSLPAQIILGFCGLTSAQGQARTGWNSSCSVAVSQSTDLCGLWWAQEQGRLHSVAAFPSSRSFSSEAFNLRFPAVTFGLISRTSYLSYESQSL